MVAHVRTPCPKRRRPAAIGNAQQIERKCVLQVLIEQATTAAR
jgi:hypothetical protein